MPSFAFPLGGSFGGDVVTAGTVDHVQSALNRLLAQFQKKDNWTSLLTAMVTQVNDLEASAQQIKTLTSIDNSFGSQLDVIGGIVGEPRQGFGDVIYRLHLKAKVFLDHSSGTAEDILQMFSALTSGASLELDEFFPAAIVVRILGVALDPMLATYFSKFLAQTRAAGVGSTFHFTPVDPTLAFTFASGPGLGFNAGAFSSATHV
jgi:Protein of unknown function (DUF2612)